LSYEEIIDSLTEEDKESDFLNDSKDAFIPTEVGKAVKELFVIIVKKALLEKMFV